MRRRQLPNPFDRAGNLDPAKGRDALRLIAELTRVVNEYDLRLQELEAKTFVETDLDIPPTRIGAIGVMSGEAYIAVGLTAADWKQVT